MVATKHGSSTKHGTNIIGHRQQHKEGRDTTIHHAKQSQLSVRVSMIESLNEEIEIKVSPGFRNKKKPDIRLMFNYEHEKV